MRVLPNVIFWRWPLGMQYTSCLVWMLIAQQKRSPVATRRESNRMHNGSYGRAATTAEAMSMVVAVPPMS